ncbi:MAG: transporter substrate-binding domain-containing protein [Xanthobacteraceae bacterium]|nr:transporter substrate-binding domain-containing protein [Xanthobacteraceae bacterium]
MSAVYLAQTILLTLGMAFAGYWSYQAFDTPPIKLGYGPALPRYMTQPGQYRLGVIVFVGTCLVIYVLIAYFHRELVPIVGALSPELQQTIEKAMKDESLSYPLVVIFSAALFLSLLKVDKDWNPIFVLRRVVHGWMSIPQIANALMVMMRDELVVPPDARAGVAGDPETPFVTTGDFDKDRRSLDRRWAELCYIRLWLERYRAQGSHFTFFNEPSFAWDQLQADYYNARDRIAPLKRGEVKDANIFADVAEKIETLRYRYCRLAACFLVFKNETQKDALRDARQFGVMVTPDPPRANPLRYVPIFVVAIIVAVYLGVTLSAMTWDLLNGNSVTLNSEITMKWIFYGLANYGTPIMVVLLLRYLGWRADRSQPNSYLISYATIALVALCVSASCLAVAQMAIGQGSLNDLRQFGLQIVANFQWGISPAAVAIYMVYHVDRQIDPLLPDIGSFEHWRFPQRLMSCVCFGMLVAGFSVPQTLGVASRSAWTVEKLQIVILGTIFVVGLVMALVGEFLLVIPTPAANRPEGAAVPPSTAVGFRKPGRWVAAGSLAAVSLAAFAVWAYLFDPVVPQWTLDRKPVYLNERIPLAWTYKLPASAASVYFEVESGAAGVFERVTCIDAEHYNVDHINATREWRVRAVADCATRTPISKWSRAIELTQYDSVYQRIKSRRQIDIFVSSSQDQDFFKWSDQGFDIDLAKLIVRNLSAQMDGVQLKLSWRSVPWEKLLPAADSRSADIAISSITKTAQREKRFAIRFTDSYYCTGYALIYQADTQEGQISDMIKGKNVGVQRETTGADLVGKLAANGLFQVTPFDNNENLQDALVASRIDFGVTDTSFAQAAQFDRRLEGVDRLKFKQFGYSDLPSTQEEPTQEYAIAVHKDELELLGAINKTLARAKVDGELASLFKTAADKYEGFKKFPPGSRSLGPRPWECFGRTTANSN